MTERWLGVDEIAQHLGVASITIYRWLDKGRIPSHRVGKLWRFKATQIDAWVSKGGAEEGSDKSSSIKPINKKSRK